MKLIPPDLRKLLFIFLWIFGVKVHSLSSLWTVYSFYLISFSILCYLQAPFLYKKEALLSINNRVVWLSLGWKVHYLSSLSWFYKNTFSWYFWVFKPSWYRCSQTGSVMVLWKGEKEESRPLKIGLESSRWDSCWVNTKVYFFRGRISIVRDCFGSCCWSMRMALSCVLMIFISKISLLLLSQIQNQTNTKNNSPWKIFIR